MSERNGGRLACRVNDGQDARPTEENATRLRGYSYENASKATGKMPALPAFSCFVVALSAINVGTKVGARG